VLTNHATSIEIGEHKPLARSSRRLAANISRLCVKFDEGLYALRKIAFGKLPKSDPTGITQTSTLRSPATEF